MRNQRPSLFRVIFADYVSLLSVLFPLIFWLFSVYYLYAGDEAARFFVILSAGLSLVGLPFFLWRYGSISGIFEDGLDAQATITGINFFRGRGRVDYAYSFQGQKYSSGNTVSKTKYTKDLRVGQQVTVCVDRNNPRRAFVKEIYL